MGNQRLIVSCGAESRNGSTIDTPCVRSRPISLAAADPDCVVVTDFTGISSCEQ